MFSSITSYLFGSYEDELTNGEAAQAPEAEELTDQDAGLDCERLQTKPAEDEWVLVEKSRTTRGSMESSSLENLLIEHPSMSVYSHRGRQSSTGMESDDSQSSTKGAEQCHARRAGLARHEPPRRPNALAARVGLNQVSAVKSMQKAQQRHLYRNLTTSYMLRSNKVQENNSRRRRHHRLHMQQPQRRCHVIKQC